MRIIRYQQGESAVLAALTDREEVYNLQESGLMELLQNAEREGVGALAWVNRQIAGASPVAADWNSLQLAVPIEAPEVWAAGVTYQRSREARNYEATDGKLDAVTFYDKVYDAERPELFMKSTKDRTVGPGGEVCLRSDSSWQVPEPELALVLASDGTIVGYTIGNDMSCRDIEGENPLYLPQAKIWRRSCAIGPAVRLAETVANPNDLAITCRIFRGDTCVLDETVHTGTMKRSFAELVEFLRRDNELFDGTVLLTGTSIVPPNDFTLEPGDRIEIAVPDIGTLANVAARA